MQTFKLCQTIASKLFTNGPVKITGMRNLDKIQLIEYRTGKDYYFSLQDLQDATILNTWSEIEAALNS